MAKDSQFLSNDGEMKGSEIGLLLRSVPAHLLLGDRQQAFNRKYALYTEGDNKNRAYEHP